MRDRARQFNRGFTGEAQGHDFICAQRRTLGSTWIFSRGIAGFVTQFGGVNSHMAIRASELSMPAVIGAGETLFRQWKKAQKLSLDCGNQQVQIVV